MCVAATAVGASLGLAGDVISIAQAAALGVAVVAACAVVARELFEVPLPVPHRRWQVPRVWLRRAWLGAFGFGSVMGAGFLTYTSSLIFYVYLLACLLSGSVWLGGAAGLFYGVSYATAVFAVSAAWRNVSPPDQTERALELGRKARLAGAVISPLVPILPLVPPVITGAS